MEKVIIAWTPTNWITIFLMAAGGFLILKGLVMAAQMAQASSR
jgi:hypothetical protein